MLHSVPAILLQLQHFLEFKPLPIAQLKRDAKIVELIVTSCRCPFKILCHTTEHAFSTSSLFEESTYNMWPDYQLFRNVARKQEIIHLYYNITTQCIDFQSKIKTSEIFTDIVKKQKTKTDVLFATLPTDSQQSVLTKQPPSTRCSKQWLRTNIICSSCKQPSHLKQTHFFINSSLYEWLLLHNKADCEDICSWESRQVFCPSDGAVASCEIHVTLLQKCDLTNRPWVLTQCEDGGRS